MSLLAPNPRIQLLPNTKRGLDTIWKDYNEIEITDTMDERKAKLEQWIAKRIGTELMRKYNQREWKVMVDIEGQLLIVACDSICNFKGYHIKMLNRTMEELIDRALMGAGEILERHNVSRNRNINPEVLDSLARDAQDSVIAADSAPEPA
jgi:hypothetical protein